MYEEKQITVGELILMLQGMPQNARVVLEGCDCYGGATGAEYRADNERPYAFIYRDDGVDYQDRRRLAEDITTL